ncbi:MAG TPA: hypothetical protein DCX07_08875 [Phycisphaerales bacterium]|nr:hypothetical protein [Phycisphaerales bacterium]
MDTSAARTSRPLVGWLLGLGATLAVLACHLAGWFDRAELITVDWRFRNFSAAPVETGIVHVDIDDRSLEEIGRWPWPRETLAGLVDVLRECGAERIALDIILPEPQEVRYVSAAGDIHAAAEKVLGIAPPRAVFDDAELAAAMARAGNVLLPLHVDLGAPAPRDPPAAKVGEALRKNPAASFQAVLVSALPGRDESVRDAAFDEVRRAYLRQRALAELDRRVLPCDVKEGANPTGQVVPPLVTFARSCRAAGFVTMQPDADGAVRRIPLLLGAEGRIYPQFALAAAADWMGATHGGEGGIVRQGDSVRIGFLDGTSRTVPVDESGRMTIYWPRGRKGDDGHAHVPARAVVAPWQARRQAADNACLGRLVALELAATLGQQDLLEQFALADRLDQQRQALRLQRRRTELFDPAAVPPPDDALAAREQAVERKLTELTGKMLAELSFYLDPLPADDPARAKIVAARDMLRRIDAENARLESLARQEARRIGAVVSGKVCLVGSNATGAADFVPTAVGERTPGVVVHAGILNTILSGRFVRRAPPAADAALILLAGALVSWIAARKPILLAALPLLAVLGAATTLLNALVVFARLDTLAVLIAPPAAMVASFLVVSAYRQLTEERARRRIRGLFANALSPELVDRLLADPSMARLGGEKRELTCFFSDLEGFTPLSERLGEQRTVQVLNRYFDRMTDVIQNRRGGYLNKFLGDGLFVFFGAPVFQEDHPHRAVHAALDCRRELDALNREFAEQFGPGVRLSCRVGIATGTVMVGNCGSSSRMDYTAIGDTVNLASRLEGANKFFGTHILAAGGAWQAAASDEFLVRPLGQALVVGKVEPVEVWHVADYAADAPEAVRRAFADFAEGVAMYARREFRDAARRFEQALAALGDDQTAALYLDLCRRFADSPPPDDWTPAIRLTDK